MTKGENTAGLVLCKNMFRQRGALAKGFWQFGSQGEQLANYVIF